MKKRILLRLVSLSITTAILFSCGGQLLAAEVDGPGFWEKTPAAKDAEEESEVDEVYEGFIGETCFEASYDLDYDSDELAEQYISQNMNPGRKVYNGTFDYVQNLSAPNRAAYEYLLEQIRAIAAGELKSTKIAIPDEVLSFEYDYESLGLTDTSNVDEIGAAAKAQLSEDGYDQFVVYDALLFSCPYDFYWMDKTTNMTSGYRMTTDYDYDTDVATVIVYGFYFNFPVAGEYQSDDNYSMNTQFGQAVTTAAANAKAVITANAAKDDYNKLLAYADAICEMVDYNDDAADDNFTYGYGNPWQLIWVFDGDDDTKVVCEGYSKAFQYLCDNTAFTDDGIYAISVVGTVVFAFNSGPHMWNVVHMDDGENYVVDVTSMDTGGSDSFLKGAETAKDDGYTLTNGHTYTYDEQALFFGTDALTLASADYEYTGTPVTYTASLGNIIKNCDPELSKTTAKEGDEITVTVNPVEGYEFDYITVNGTKITETKFTMPAEDVVVNVYCKKTVYTITCSAATNGTVTTNTATANVGDQITVTATPADGYVLDALTVKDAAGNSIEVANGEFEMPASNVTVSATFKKIVYKVEFGTLLRNCNPELSKSKANEGDKITVTVNPVPGYEFSYIEVNGIQYSKPEFTMPAENVVVNVVCTKIQYPITCSEAQNGKVTTNTSSANGGDVITITVTPDSDYELDTLTVKDAKGNIIEVNADNEFKMPDSAVTVSATFKKIVSQTGWVQDGDIWYYIMDDGTKATGWYKVGAWYYFDNNGVMLTGWQKIDGEWYYMKPSGSMVTGWLEFGNGWYFLKSSGAMATGWQKLNGNWYLFNASGKMLTGWQKDGGEWYYLDYSSGAMKTGWIKSGGNWYYMKSNGVMATGWAHVGSYWYYMDKNGAMVTGWITEGNYKYYLDADGRMVTGTVRIDGKRYRFDDSGHCLNP